MRPAKPAEFLRVQVKIEQLNTVNRQGLTEFLPGFPVILVFDL